MRRAILVSSRQTLLVSTAFAGFLALTSGVWAQGSSVDIGTVDVKAKRPAAAKRPAKPVATKPTPTKVVTRPAAKPRGARVAAPVARPAAQPSPAPAPRGVDANGTPTGVAPAFAGGQVASGGRLGILGNTDVKKAPFSISSYTEKFFRDRQAATASDALAADPSVRAEQARGGTLDAFFIRGFPFNEGNVGEFAFDGLYGIAPNYRIFTDYAERIEVLKGPSAAISGVAPNGAVGGVINVVPKRAGDDLTRLTFGFGSSLNGGVQADVSRRYGLNREWGIRFAGNLHAGDTPVDKQSERTALGSLAIDYQGDRFRSWLYLLTQTDQYKAPSRPFFATTGILIPSAPDGSLNISQPWEYSRQDDKGGLLKTEYDLSKTVTLFADVGGSVGTVNRFFGNPVLTSSAGDFTNTPAFFDQSVKRYTYDGGVRAGFDTGFVHHAFVLQASLYHDAVDRVLNNGTAYTSNIYAPAYQSIQFPNTSGYRTPLSSNELTGLSIVDTLSVLNERVLLTAGVRRQGIVTDNFVANVGTLSSSNDSRAITPIVGLVVRPTENISVYGNYIEGLSRGDAAPATATNFGEVLAPYIARQYEVGVKGQFGRIGTSLAAFQITKALGELNTSTLTFASTGEERVRGLEFTTFGEVADGVRILGGASYLDGVLTRTAVAANIGNTPIGVPHIQVNGGGELDVPWIIRGASLNGMVIYTGSQYADAANLQPISGWTRLDLGARYVTTIQNRRTTFRFNVENVTGTKYYTGVASYGTFYFGNPRTYFGSISVDL